MSTHELVRANLERLHRLAWRLLGGDDRGAQDVVQRAFAKARLDPSRDAAWLTRTVVHEATKHRRWRFARFPRGPRSEASDPVLREIRDAVRELTDGQREAFVLVHLEGHSIVEAVDLLGETERTAQIDLLGAFGRLRAALAHLNETDRDLLETIRTLYRPQPIASWEPVRRSSRHALAIAITMAVAFLVWSRPTEHDVATPPPSEEPVLHTLRGWVTTVTGATVGGAVVTARGAAVETGPDGAFEIADVPASAVQVSVQAPGLSTAEARVDPRLPLTLQLLPLTGRGTIDATAGGNLTDTKGFSLVVPADSFPGVAGPIDVEWTVLRDAGSLGAAPSPLATEHDLLESFGMVEVRFAQNGAPVEFRGTADLTWPLVADAPFRDGEPAGLYSYDRDAGVWREDGEGTVKKGRIHAQVTHFSWWSCDRPIAERGCVAGRLDGPLSSTIYLEGDDYLARVATAPGQDGAFCLDAMPARSARLFSKSRVGDRCYVSSERVVASAAGTSCAIDRSECAAVRLWSTEVACPQPTPWRGDRRAQN